MKTTVFRISCFLLALFIGTAFFAVYAWFPKTLQAGDPGKEYCPLNSQFDNSGSEYSANYDNDIFYETNFTNANSEFVFEKQPENAEDDEEYVDPYETDYPLEMLIPGEYHGDEVTADSGEKWLAFFTENGKAHLEWKKIKIEKVRDQIIDGENGEITGKKVSAAGKKQPLLLLKGDQRLKPHKNGITLLDAKRLEGDSYEEITRLKNGYFQDFFINSNKFTISVDEPKSDTIYGIEKSQLSVKSAEAKLVVFPLQGAVYNEYWSLHWVGDLDGDGKLDFLANLTNHENATVMMLFLSSYAEEGELVKAAAILATIGC